jgi:ketosteroid isomerase-like protein
VFQAEPNHAEPNHAEPNHAERSQAEPNQAEPNHAERSQAEPNHAERSQAEPNRAGLPFRAAMEARDLAAVVDAFAPDAVLRSPLTTRLTFTGPEQIGALAQVLVEVFDDLRYTDEACDGTTGFLSWRARIGGQEIEGADLLRFGPDGKIRELTAFFRPLPAAALALRLIGAGLVRRKSPARAMVVSSLTRPVAALTRAGDPVGVRLVRSAL